MKTFNRFAAQGDMLIERVNAVHELAAKIEPSGDIHIVAHSETGHHHVISAAHCERYVQSDFVSYLDVSAPTPLEHRRPHDTHEPIMLDVGIYRIRRQREYTPEGFRRVED